ncbi:MAG: winged helix DNA-binding domain-containing protein [Robiginitomaculum sp.]|nr:winged helix DNA-binding domain-containing protein [Robiginitomaculum sp.]
MQAADGSWHAMLAPPDIETRLAAIKSSTTRLRIINPFDPAIRDRDRLLKLFGFAYSIEIFVPAAKRQWGYYVYPLLEKDRFIGRIELKADRKTSTLCVKKLWAEPGLKWTDRRAQKLSAELTRLSKFIGCKNIVWNCPHIP